MLNHSTNVCVYVCVCTLHMHLKIHNFKVFIFIFFKVDDQLEFSRHCPLLHSVEAGGQRGGFI